MHKRALVVGINTYGPDSLQFARKDAEVIANALEGEHFGFSVVRLFDQDATRSNIRRELNSLFLDKESLCLFFFAGHGDIAPDGFYLRSSNYSPNDWGIDIDFLKRLMGLPAGGARIAMLDCCFSGTAGLASESDMAQVRARVDGDLRGLPEQRVVIAACRSWESALELNGHGIFTSHLVAGLSGGAADGNGDITANSLYDYLSSAMASTDDQQPVFKGDLVGKMLLGTGFGRVMVRALKEKEIKTHVAKAGRMLDLYEERPSLGREERLRTGYKSDTQALTPIVNWFEKRIQEQADLMRNKEFSGLFRALTAARAKLGTLETGIELAEGKVVRMMGEGSFGSVWEVCNPGERTKAYKVYSASQLSDTEKIRRFRRGFDAMQQLDHPNIVKVIKHTTVPLGFFMEFIDGPNLRKLGPMEPGDAVGVLVGVADTLRHTHQRSVIHRDIKPENIIVRYNPTLGGWEPFLTDFDLAWFSSATRMTKEGLGSTYYAAPEQLSAPGSRAAHARAVDVYSFGQLCFFVLTQNDPTSTSNSKNAEVLGRRLDRWTSAEAARGLLNLYTECSQEEPDKRPRDFSVIWSRLVAINALLRISATDRDVTQAQFLEEVKYQLVGLMPPNIGSTREDADTIHSRSGRTMLAISVVDRPEPWCDVGVNVRLSEMSGFSTHKEGRTILNQRISEATADAGDVRIIRGSGAGFEVSIVIGKVYMNTSGITRCAQVIGQVIDACERG